MRYPFPSRIREEHCRIERLCAIRRVRVRGCGGFEDGGLAASILTRNNRHRKVESDFLFFPLMQTVYTHSTKILRPRRIQHLVLDLFYLFVHQCSTYRSNTVTLCLQESGSRLTLTESIVPRAAPPAPSRSAAAAILPVRPIEAVVVRE